MPELPEVETVVRTLAPQLTGRRILAAEFFAPRILRGSQETQPEKFADNEVREVRRHGKNVLIQLSSGLLVVHLGMTGKLLLDAPTGPYTRAIFHLDQGTLVYDDVRQFGRIEWCPELPARLQALGPEPVTIPFEDFWERLQSRKGRIKALLLNQTFLRGVGNIYADEMLFQSGIHPLTLSTRMSRSRACRLHQAMQEVLMLAIEHRGSSISDYVDADGNRGGFQMLHQVYGKEGQPCSRCGSPIRKTVVAQRGTHFCPKCQRA